MRELQVLQVSTQPQWTHLWICCTFLLYLSVYDTNWDDCTTTDLLGIKHITINITRDFKSGQRSLFWCLHLHLVVQLRRETMLGGYITWIWISSASRHTCDFLPLHHLFVCWVQQTANMMRDVTSHLWDRTTSLHSPVRAAPSAPPLSDHAWSLTCVLTWVYMFISAMFISLGTLLNKQGWHLAFSGPVRPRAKCFSQPARPCWMWGQRKKTFLQPYITRHFSLQFINLNPIWVSVRW